MPAADHEKTAPLGNKKKHLDHKLDEAVDLRAMMTGVIALIEVKRFLPEASVRVR